VFQSLVGKLETNESGVEMNKRSMFQSLVGKLETDTSKIVDFVAYGFQSLVGKLETMGEIKINKEVEQVSIPCR